MQPATKLAAIATAVLCLAIPAAAPLLALGFGTTDGHSCNAGAEDGSPPILGQSRLTYGEITNWWATEDRGEPASLGISTAQLVDIYLREGATEGVRGDLALAQAVHETGWFTNSDTAIHNYAGIAHPDGATSGKGFRDPATGIRAQIQLLKKFAEGNDVALANTDVAPTAAAHATTWAELGGTWASDPNYWAKINSIYMSIGGSSYEASGSDNCVQAPEQPAGSLISVRGITVDASIGAELDAMVTAAQAGGVTLTGTGYRSTDRQIELRRAHCGTSQHAIFEMPANDCSPPTARPGESMHERGLAVDFDNCASTATACWRWLNAHATAYGFHPHTQERWHWSTDGT